MRNLECKQPERLTESSRRSERSGDLRCAVENLSAPRRGARPCLIETPSTFHASRFTSASIPKKLKRTPMPSRFPIYFGLRPSDFGFATPFTLYLLLTTALPCPAADLVHAKDGSGVYGYKDTPKLPWCQWLVHDP